MYPSEQGTNKTARGTSKKTGKDTTENASEPEIQSPRNQPKNHQKGKGDKTKIRAIRQQSDNTQRVLSPKSKGASGEHYFTHQHTT